MKYAGSSLEASLDYSKLGFAVVPSDTPTHREYAAQNRFRPQLEWPSSPSSDPATIVGWYRRAPYAGVALALEPSGLLAIEAIGAQGSATLEAWMDEHDGWYAWETTSFEAGDTRTLLYRADSRPVGAELQLGLGVVGRGAGYVILPPSQNVAGEFCQWDDADDLTITIAPSWLVDKFSVSVEVAA